MGRLFLCMGCASWRSSSNAIVVHIFVMRIVIFFLLFFLSSLGVAAESVTVDEGVKMVFEGNQVALRVQGKPIWTKALSDVDNKARAHLKGYDVVGPAVAVHLTVPLESGNTMEAVFLIKKGRTHVETVWEGTTGLKGDMGERIATAVRFEDLSGDGKPEIVVGEVSEAVKLCGQQRRPLLFRRVFDVETGKFRPVLARRVGISSRPVDVVGVYKSETSAPPIFDTVFAGSTSRSIDDHGDVLLLSKPASMLDDNEETGWRPWPGNGAGEFVTFNTVSESYGITEIGIVPIHGRLKKRPYDRPKTLLMTSEDGVYRLMFTETAMAEADGAFWFVLPRPLKTACFSLVVESSYGGDAQSPLGLAEVFVKTEIDGPKGIERLARDLGNLKLRRQAAMLLKKAGGSASKPITEIFETLDVPGRRLAVDVIGEVDPEGGIALLAAAALGADEVARDAALVGLKKVPLSAVRVLAKSLSSTDRKKAETAVSLIASLGSTAAVEVLCNYAGSGDKSMRRRIRGALRALVMDTESGSEALWQAVAAAGGDDAWERTIDLVRVAASVPSLTERVYGFVDAVFDKKTSFEDRYRLLSVLSDLGCEYGKERLIAASGATDPQIRVVAVMGLGDCIPPDDKVMKIIDAALKDPETPVRLAALSAIAEHRAADTFVRQLAALSAKDMWPEVRAVAVAVVFGLSADNALPVLETAEHDASLMVRKAALNGAMRFSSERADAIIVRRLQDEKEAAELKIRAAQAAGRRCQENALPALVALLKKGAEPLAPHDDVEIALAAANAMGHIGTAQAKAMLTDARKRSNPATDKAIDAALKFDGGCGGSPRTD